MDSNDAARRVMSCSDDGIIENRPSYKQSMTTAELSDNIEAAVMHYDSIQKEVEFLRSKRFQNANRNDNALSQESSSSYSSLKQISEHLFENKPSNIYNFFIKPEKTNTTPTKETENQVQIIVTPRSENKESQNDDKAAPNLELRINESLESTKTNKRLKKTSKLKKKSQISRISEDQLKTSLIYSAKAKRKKFHGRLKNSNSKSTIVTRDSFSDKKADKKNFKRQKSLDAVSLLKAQQYRKRVGVMKTHESKVRPKDFIEIFHNQKHDNPPVIFDRRSKVSRKAQPPQGREEAASDEKRRLQAALQPEEDAPVRINATRTNVRDASEVVERKVEVIEEEKQPTDERSGDLYDPFHQRNYEMPTESSKNRQVRRPNCYPRYSMKYIPFVPGTSLSPSHNLCLNIQQVLGIIKSKQPAIPGIDPALIRQVSRGLSPVTSLFESINKQFARSCRIPSREFRSNSAIRQTDNAHSCERLRASSSLPLSMANRNHSCKQSFACEPLYEENEESHSSCSESRVRDDVAREKATSWHARPEDTTDKLRRYAQADRQRRSRKNSTNADSSTANDFHHPLNTEEMSEVLTRLYNQFNNMITRHDKLKEQLVKHKDTSLVKEISELESEMRAKEQEITAVVNLYKEVTYLKQHVKRIYERNSFVCITAQDPTFYQATRSSKARARTAGYFECRSRPKFHLSHGNQSVHGAPNALRLIGLLRQMQAFQRQLALV